ncbi:MAG: Ig-like domain-containing protein [Muribaculaceae bacterium]|nr:Ig-like domain-containing protein [Muribaculaceae bacterium]
MKKLFTFIVGAVVGLGAYAQDFDSGGLNYSVLSPDDKTCAVTGYNDLGSVLEIPESVSYEGEEYTVTEVGERAFPWTGVSEVSFPSTLEAIGESAFWNCNGINEIVIPNSVKEIGSSCFGACYGLSRVVLGSSVEVLGRRAFGGCESLGVVVALGETPAQCEDGFSSVFDSNPLVAVSENLVDTYKAAWEGANVVANVDAESLTFDPHMYNVQPGGTVQLNCIAVPANAPYKFINNYQNIISVDDNGLVTADNLKGGFGVVVRAVSLNGMTAECTISIDSLEEFESEGLVFAVIPNAESEAAVIRYESNAAEVTIPETVEYNGNVYSVTAIGPEVFNGNETLVEVVIPASVTLIRDRNFNYCYSLKKVTIADSSTPLVLSNYNFTDCRNLEEVYVGRNLTYSEGSMCFRWNGSLSHIVLGTEVTSLPDYIFRECYNLNLVESKNPVPPTIGDDVFSYTIPTIIVPAGSVEAYQTAWEQYASYITEQVDATSISFETDEMTIYNGQYIQLALTVEPEDATVVWSSSNPDLVSVNKEGNISYYMWDRNVGEAVITASTLNGLTAECTVTAKHWLTFQEDKVSMANGETYQVEVEKPEVLADATITWTSSDEAVATVDENGLITAVANGNARISASVEVAFGEGWTESFSYPINVEVRSEPISVTPENSSIPVWVGDSEPIYLTFEPDDEYVNREMTWIVADPEIAEVYTEYGVYRVRGLKAGNTTITGTTVNGLTVDIEVAVKTMVDQIVFSKETIYLSPDESAKLEFTTVPEVTNVTFAYQSDNEEVATVDEEGIITAHSLGSAWITVFSENPWGDYDWRGYVRVVVDNYPESVTLLDQDIKVVNGSNVPLNLVYSPDGDDINKEMTWTLDNPEIAYIQPRWNYDTWQVIGYQIFGQSLGTTSFTGATLNGKTVTGTVSVEGLNMYYGSKDSNEMSVGVGETVQLEIEANPEEILNTVTFESDNNNIATVSPEGLVAGIAPGNVWIRARYVMNDNEYTDDMYVTVRPESGTISFAQRQMVVKPGDWTALEVIFPEGEESDITWESSDYNVVSLYEHGSWAQLIYEGVGIATVTATASNGATATCDVICANPAMNETNVVMGLDQTRQLEVLGIPEGLDVSISWWTDDWYENVLKVSDGQVTAVDYGSATVYANVSTTEGVDLGQARADVSVIEIVPVSEITLDPDYIDIDEYFGQTVWVNATVMPEDATFQQLEWTSSDESVAVVDQYGYVTVVGHGYAVITATATDGSGVSGTCIVSDPPTLVESITLSTTKLVLKEGETAQLTASVWPYDATNTSVIWSSDRPSVASVDDWGNVTALAQGAAIITATAADGSGVSADCKIVVQSRELPDIPIYVESIQLSTDDWAAKVGETLQLEAEVTPVYATNKRIYWSSSDESVVSVDYKGVMTAVGVGEAVVTAQVFDGSGVTAECHVTVSEADPDSVFGISVGDDTTFDVYTQQGILLKRACTAAELKELQSGIYIIRSGQTVKTVYIRN